MIFATLPLAVANLDVLRVGCIAHDVGSFGALTVALGLETGIGHHLTDRPFAGQGIESAVDRLGLEPLVLNVDEVRGF